MLLSRAAALFDSKMRPAGMRVPQECPGSKLQVQKKIGRPQMRSADEYMYVGYLGAGAAALAFARGLRVGVGRSVTGVPSVGSAAPAGTIHIVAVIP
jgi:hypothetical protein